MFKIDDPKNNAKSVSHAFFLALAVTIAEPSTILPLMVHHFSDSTVIVGIFASLLRGGAIVVQLYAAFHAQVYGHVLPYLRKVFMFRFLSWFLIGVSILVFADISKTLTLLLIGIGLFFFSFMAGFGAIYFKELQAKLFTKKYRGKSMANRMIAKSIASIISGGVAGYVLSIFEAPLNFAYLFMISSFFMLVGFISFGSMSEPEKKNLSVKEKHFGIFIKNAFAILKKDKRLQLQIVVLLLGYGYFLSLPFIILNANKSFTLTGWMLGGFITIQMIGSIFGSMLVWKKMYDYSKMLSLSIFVLLLAIIIAIFADNFYMYALIFLLVGAGLDGQRIADMNLVLEIAPEDKRPIYSALQNNLTSIGLFFPVLGGVLLNWLNNYTLVYIITVVILVISFTLSLKLVKSDNAKLHQ